MKLVLVFINIWIWGGSAIADGVRRHDVDIIIKNGQVVDGNGGPRFRADIAIVSDHIVAMGNLKNHKAKLVIDAAGLIIAPGFIDGHSHTARYMVENENRLNESSLTQGVSTIVFGADGDYSSKALKVMLDVFQKQGIGTNVGFYVGHNGIRKEVMQQDQNRKPTKNELSVMQNLVKEGMRMGAVGFSTGLMYDPGGYSDTEEIVSLSKVIAEFGGIYDSHVRDPANALIASDQEVVEIGQKAGVAAKVAHLKAVCLRNRGNTKAIIDLVNRAREQGQNIVSDQYPYDGAKTVFLRDIVLSSNLDTVKNDLKTLLRDLSKRDKLRQVSEQGVDGGFSWLKATGYDCIRITHSLDYPEYEGKYLLEIAFENGQSGFDVVSELLIAAKYDIRVTLGGVDEQEVRMLLVQPWNMVVSDGKYINADSSVRQHPRSTGTFTRVLGKYVRELNLLPLEQAIKKMTSQPADFLGFSDRGRIAVGKKADVVVFDEKTIRDQSDWASPLKYSKGIHHLLVNGKFAVKNGNVTSEASGAIVTRTHKTPALLTPAKEDTVKREKKEVTNED